MLQLTFGVTEERSGNARSSRPEGQELRRTPIWALAYMRRRRFAVRNITNVIVPHTRKFPMGALKLRRGAW
jgi:hypothetical protein